MRNVEPFGIRRMEKSTNVLYYFMFLFFWHFACDPKSGVCYQIVN